jgi:DNA-binding transcriptional ArsR family regulator
LTAEDRHVEAFKALAHPTRLEVVFFLVSRKTTGYLSASDFS